LIRRWKDGVRFGLSAAVLSSVSVLATYVARNPSAAADEKAWARTILAAMVSAMAGYFIGKKDKD
jgi:hypothetical protein